MSWPLAVMAYGDRRMFVSDKEKKKVLGLFEHELPGMPSRSHEQMVRELKARAERFYEEASLEEIRQFTRMARQSWKPVACYLRRDHRR
jgi:hypothetical protein